jgi:hypothetical protein
MKKLIVLSIILFFCTAPFAFADVVNEGDQSGTTNSAATSGSAATVNMGSQEFNQGDTIYEGSKRGVNGVAAPAGEITYPGMPGRFDAAPERYGYMNHMKIKDILEYDEDGLTVNMAEEMANDEAWNGKRILVRPKFGILVEDKRLPKDVPIPVKFEKGDGMQSLGVVTVVSDSKKSISADVFAEVMLKAWELGAVALHVKAEGFQREIHSEGAGIGFTWTGVSVSGDTTSAMTGVLGAGKSWGQAGYYDHPFITVIPLAPKNLKFSDAGWKTVDLRLYLKDTQPLD